MAKKRMAFRKSAEIKIKKHPEWQAVRMTYEHEMKPILAALEDENVSSDIKACLKNYLVIALVSTIENHLRALARRNIDQWNMDVSKVVEGEITLPLSALVDIAKHHVTKGSLVVSNFSFANPNEVNDFFSKLLNLDFFDIIKELDRLDPSNYFHYAASLNRNWRSFIQMFEMRNLLVHKRTPIKLSVKQLRSLCNCTMNFLDASQVVCNQEYQESLQVKLAWLRQRHAAKQQRKTKSKSDTGEITSHIQVG